MDSIGGFAEDGSPVIGTTTYFAPEAMPDAHAHARGQLAWCPNRAVMVLADAKLHLMSPSAAIWLPPGQTHRITSRAARQSVNLYTLPGATPLPDRIVPFALGALERELMLTMAGASRSDRCEAAFERLASVLWDRLRVPAGTPGLTLPSHPKLRRIVLAQIEGQDGKTLDGWADILALSRRSLQRLVTRETGKSWRGWMRELRLGLAVTPLMEGQSVQEAAHSAGYATASGFVAAFRACYGITPGEMQRKIDT
ncbi:MAG: helix-turn-helix transcriptional regulator [Paracoccus sp. (in: a-proteobacteria)]|uniref:AraC family transcriptional regulator n=1 Tax=Paracoccus sp. TaxID=267 RepID=UPI0039E438E5